MLEDVVNKYNAAVTDTNRIEALQVVREAIEDGVTPEDIIFKVVVPNIEMMVKSFSESFDTNLAQHFIASQIASEITEEMIPRFKSGTKNIGKIVIGNAYGDFHGLGKKIVMGCLKAQMIEPVDLGLNVAAEQFVRQAIDQDAQVIGISSMMVHTARGTNGCLKVREILKKEKLEDKIKVIVGGAPYRFNPELYKIVKADSWAHDGIIAAKLITQLIQEVKK